MESPMNIGRKSVNDSGYPMSGLLSFSQSLLLPN